MDANEVMETQRTSLEAAREWHQNAVDAIQREIAKLQVEKTEMEDNILALNTSLDALGTPPEVLPGPAEAAAESIASMAEDTPEITEEDRQQQILDAVKVRILAIATGNDGEVTRTDIVEELGETFSRTGEHGKLVETALRQLTNSNQLIKSDRKRTQKGTPPTTIYELSQITANV